MKVGRCHVGVSENVVYPIVPNGFADPYPYEKWLAIIGKINPTFSVTNPNHLDHLGFVNHRHQPAISSSHRTPPQVPAP